MPSIFDTEKYEARQILIFFKKFIEAISKPIQKDGQEHIDYVPSQVVSEYFAEIFKKDDNHQLDGIVYPSAVSPNGKNIVLFPRYDFLEKDTFSIKYQENETEIVDFKTWKDLFEKIGNS
jgi:hypothetical protein